MKFTTYSDEVITDKQIRIAVPSMIIGVGVLSLPGGIASATMGADGWVSLVIAGVSQMFIIYIMAKVASSFPKQSFLAFTSKLVSKPVAVILTLLFAIFYTGVAAYDLRMLGHTSEQYLFNHTPVEIVTLTFLLVVIYAVSGSRAGIMRLNILFLPTIFVALFIVLVLSIKFIDPSNVLPMFKTDIKGYWDGIRTSALSYIGVSIVLFYTAFVDKPKNIPKASVVGMIVPIIVYILVYLACILVFGQSATSHLLFPTVDLAKRLDLPGGILERMEAIFFTVWTLGVFTTAIMAFDIALLALQSLFKRIKKIHLIFMLSPILYYISMIPKNTSEIVLYGDYLASFLYIYGYVVAILLFIVLKARKGKTNEKKNP